MKTLVISSIICLFGGLGQSGSQKIVYISTGPKAYAYHSRITCARLKKCREEGHVKSITLTEAKKLGRTPCGTCYR